MRRVGSRGLKVSLLLALTFLWPACRGTDEQPAQARPVLLITVGGLVAADLEAFGGTIELPRLEALVAQSAVWPKALSAAPLTRAAVATYMTGLAPDRHGVRDDLFARLPEDIPTLAELLGARGYQTAAFPDSSFLGEDSGLWRGFDLVDNPPPAAFDASRWLPRFHDEKKFGAATEWLGSLEGEAPWFGWVHLSHPLLGQFRETFARKKNVVSSGQTDPASPEADAPEDDTEAAALEDDTASDALDADAPAAPYLDSLQAFDRQLGRVLDAVDARNDGALVVLATTFGDVRLDRERKVPMGLGFSLDATRVDVPVLIRFPDGVPAPEASLGTVWSPDVAATIAAWTGVELDRRAEGRDLRNRADLERTVFSWSWAPLDQCGWRPLVLAADAERRLVLSGDRVVEGQDDASLRQSILARQTPPLRQLPSDISDALLARVEIEPDPLALEGRDFDDPDVRLSIVSRLWLARNIILTGKSQRGLALLASISGQSDERNVAAWLDRGQALALARNPESARVLEEALKSRPRDGDIWHWYAHALLRTHLDDAEAILVAIQPHLSHQADVLYDLACTRSLAQDEEASGDYLTRAWHAGFRERALIESDPDLRYLRETGKLSEVLRQLQ